LTEEMIRKEKKFKGYEVEWISEIY